MDYIVGLKDEMSIYSEEEAQHRYIELLGMGYSDSDIVFATTVPVKVDFKIEAGADNFIRPQPGKEDMQQLPTENPS